MQIDICHYWYFLHKGFKIQPYVCNGCRDLLMMSVNLGNIAIWNNKGADCHCILLAELAKMRRETSCKMLIWLKEL